MRPDRRRCSVGRRQWLAGGSSAVSKGKAGLPPNGALIITTAGKMSGRAIAHIACEGRAGIMAYHGGDRPVAERQHQAQGIPHLVQRSKRREVRIVIRTPAGGATVAANIGGDDVIAGLCQRNHHVPPTVGQLGKAMQQQQGRSISGLVTRFQYMHAQSVDVVDESRPYAVRQPGGRVGFQLIAQARRLGIHPARDHRGCPKRSQPE